MNYQKMKEYEHDINIILDDYVYERITHDELIEKTNILLYEKQLNHDEVMFLTVCLGTLRNHALEKLDVM